MNDIPHEATEPRPDPEEHRPDSGEHRPDTGEPRSGSGEDRRDASGAGAAPEPAPEGEAPRAAPEQPLRERAVAAIQTVYDPEIPVDIYQLGLIYDIEIHDPGDRMLVRMTLTSPTCPAAGTLPAEVQTKLQKLEGVSEVKIELTWDPPWTPDMMSEAAKLQLGVM